MQLPHIELIPSQAAVCSDRCCTLDVLVKVISPSTQVRLERPALNLALVLDRSSSVKGDKIEFVRQAACYVVQQLLPSDRISVTVFDREVRTLVSSRPAIDKTNIIHQIQQIQPGLGTALHAGWLAGGLQVIKHVDPNCLNRVILLSDGFASAGEKNVDEIIHDVDGLAQKGVSTTTISIGDIYNENLLLAMACHGGGSYYCVQSCQQLPEIFHHELEDLIATLGNNVSMAVDPQGDVEIEDVFNDLEVDHCGRFQLPSLVMGNCSELLVRLRVPAMIEAANLCNFRLMWDDPKQQRRKLQASLRLPVINFGQLQEFVPNLEVKQQLALLMAVRVKKEALRQLDRGNYETASSLLKKAKKFVLNAPNSLLMKKEAEALADLDKDLQVKQWQTFRKQATHKSYETQFTSLQKTDFDY